MNRHLYYYVYPLDNDCLRVNLYQIKSKLGLFNGQKLFVVGSDSNTLPLDYVVNFMDDDSIKYHVIDNKNSMGQADSFNFGLLYVFQCFGDTNEDITLYCHSKGVTKPFNLSVQIWRDILYDLSTRDIDTVEQVLAPSTNFVCCGPLKQDNFWPIANTSNVSFWHYSGTFFWINNGKLCKYENYWSTKSDGYYHAEKYLGRIVNTKDAYNLTHKDDTENDTKYRLNRNQWRILLQNTGIKI